MDWPSTVQVKKDEEKYHVAFKGDNETVVNYMVDMKDKIAKKIDKFLDNPDHTLVLKGEEYVEDSNAYDMNSCQMDNNMDHKKVSQTFNNIFDPKHPEREILTKVYTENYFKMRKPETLKKDLKDANVTLEQFNAMINKNRPLAFTTTAEYNDFGRELHKAVAEGCIPIVPDITPPPFRLVISGTSTSFYSENPGKQGHFFDKPGAEGDKSDIDVAIQFTDDSYREKFVFNTKNREEHPSQSEYLRKQQYSQSDTSTILKLNEFHAKWGPNDFQFKNKKIPINSTILKRCVGVVTFKLPDTEGHNTLCDYRFYYPSA